MITVRTFNLNNLFSRLNFRGRIADLPNDDGAGIILSFGVDKFKARTFMGRLVRQKDPDDTVEVTRRIREVMNVDVLAVQEIEHIEILREFNRHHLNNMYDHVVLVEGKDRRLIVRRGCKTPENAPHQINGHFRTGTN